MAIADPLVDYLETLSSSERWTSLALVCGVFNGAAPHAHGDLRRSIVDIVRSALDGDGAAVLARNPFNVRRVLPMLVFLVERGYPEYADHYAKPVALATAFLGEVLTPSGVITQYGHLARAGYDVHHFNLVNEFPLLPLTTQWWQFDRGALGHTMVTLPEMLESLGPRWTTRIPSRYYAAFCTAWRTCLAGALLSNDARLLARLLIIAQDVFSDCPLIPIARQRIAETAITSPIDHMIIRIALDTPSSPLGEFHC